MSDDEKIIQGDIQIAITGMGDGSRVFRNNVGQYTDDHGNVVRYGVCNPGGSDLIGWKRIEVTPEMVGRTLAVFLAIEVKRPGKTPTKYQKRFINVVNGAGGIAFVATSPNEAEERACNISTSTD